ncbi:MAG: mechanosensitive ion channel [Ignavibacteriae bacterium]|nr:mechanosensitive ion channel [Ignavibacteriota bacterium]
MEFEKAINLITEKLETWFNEFVRLLPNILLAALILVIGIFAARIIRNFSAKYVKKISSNSALNSLFSSIIYVFLIGVTIFTALSILQLDKAVTSILAGAGIIGLALAFAFQDIASNFISGIFISFRKPISIDDIVKVGEYLGEIKEINLRDTVLQTFQGEIVIIPNKDLFQNPIVNYSSLGKRRFDLSVGVSYGEDLEKVREVTLNAVKEIEELCKEKETTLFFDGFGDSSINFTIRLWVDNCSQSSYLTTGNKAIMLIKKAYNENDIMIPFPIRTLDFGIKGGVPLKDILPGKE